MPKKSKKHKQMAALRREVGLLRAQVENTDRRPGETVFETTKEIKRETVAETSTRNKEPVLDLDFKYLTKDIRKTAILTVISLAIIFSLYITESHWINIL